MAVIVLIGTSIPTVSKHVSVSPERLREFFAPRSLAVVGASDSSGWAQFILASGAAAGFPGPLIPVHPRHETVFGLAVRSLRDLAEPVDLAFVMVPTDAVPEVIDDAAAAGVRHAVVLASGYREAGRRAARARTGWSRTRPGAGSCSSGRTASASSTPTRPPGRSR